MSHGCPGPGHTQSLAALTEGTNQLATQDITAAPDWTGTGTPEVPPLADASLLREPPVTARGMRTRAALVAAARRVFERDGYIDARLTDITREAACSTGNFYTYFAGKEEVFHAVLEAVQDDMLHPGFGRHADPGASPYAVIETSNRAYLEAYQRNAKLMMLLEQVATVDARFREIRRRRSRAFVIRNARGIADLQARGLADPDLDAYQAARALSAMVARTAYNTFCLADEETTIDSLADTCTRLWVNALRLTR